MYVALLCVPCLLLCYSILSLFPCFAFFVAPAVLCFLLLPFLPYVVLYYHVL
jgi:hypothetical protein